MDPSAAKGVYDPNAANLQYSNPMKQAPAEPAAPVGSGYSRGMTKGRLAIIIGVLIAIGIAVGIGVSSILKDDEDDDGGAEAAVVEYDAKEVPKVAVSATLSGMTTAQFNSDPRIAAAFEEATAAALGVPANDVKVTGVADVAGARRLGARSLQSGGVKVTFEVLFRALAADDVSDADLATVVQTVSAITSQPTVLAAIVATMAAELEDQGVVIEGVNLAAITIEISEAPTATVGTISVPRPTPSASPQAGATPAPSRAPAPSASSSPAPSPAPSIELVELVRVDIVAEMRGSVPRSMLTEEFRAQGVEVLARETSQDPRQVNITIHEGSPVQLVFALFVGDGNMDGRIDELELQSVGADAARDWTNIIRVMEYHMRNGLRDAVENVDAALTLQPVTMNTTIVRVEPIHPFVQLVRAVGVAEIRNWDLSMLSQTDREATTAAAFSGILEAIVHKFGFERRRTSITRVWPEGAALRVEFTMFLGDTNMDGLVSPVEYARAYEHVTANSQNQVDLIQSLLRKWFGDDAIEVEGVDGSVDMARVLTDAPAVELVEVLADIEFVGLTISEAELSSELGSTLVDEVAKLTEMDARRVIVSEVKSVAPLRVVLSMLAGDDNLDGRISPVEEGLMELSVEERAPTVLAVAEGVVKAYFGFLRGEEAVRSVRAEFRGRSRSTKSAFAFDPLAQLVNVEAVLRVQGLAANVVSDQLMELGEALVAVAAATTGIEAVRVSIEDVTMPSTSSPLLITFSMLTGDDNEDGAISAYEYFTTSLAVNSLRDAVLEQLGGAVREVFRGRLNGETSGITVAWVSDPRLEVRAVVPVGHWVEAMEAVRGVRIEGLSSDALVSSPDAVSALLDALALVTDMDRSRTSMKTISGESGLEIGIAFLTGDANSDARISPVEQARVEDAFEAMDAAAVWAAGLAALRETLRGRVPNVDAITITPTSANLAKTRMLSRAMGVQLLDARMEIEFAGLNVEEDDLSWELADKLVGAVAGVVGGGVDPRRVSLHDVPSLAPLRLVVSVLAGDYNSDGRVTPLEALFHEGVTTSWIEPGVEAVAAVVRERFGSATPNLRDVSVEAVPALALTESVELVEVRATFVVTGVPAGVLDVKFITVVQEAFIFATDSDRERVQVVDARDTTAATPLMMTIAALVGDDNMDGHISPAERDLVSSTVASSTSRVMETIQGILHWELSSRGLSTTGVAVAPVVVDSYPRRVLATKPFVQLVKVSSVFELRGLPFEVALEEALPALRFRLARDTDTAVDRTSVDAVVPSGDAIFIEMSVLAGDNDRDGRISPAEAAWMEEDATAMLESLVVSLESAVRRAAAGWSMAGGGSLDAVRLTLANDKGLHVQNRHVLASHPIVETMRARMTVHVTGLREELFDQEMAKAVSSVFASYVSSFLGLSIDPARVAAEDRAAEGNAVVLTFSVLFGDQDMDTRIFPAEDFVAHMFLEPVANMMVSVVDSVMRVRISELGSAADVAALRNATVSLASKEAMKDHALAYGPISELVRAMVVTRFQGMPSDLLDVEMGSNLLDTIANVTGVARRRLAILDAGPYEEGSNVFFSVLAGDDNHDGAISEEEFAGFQAAVNEITPAVLAALQETANRVIQNRNIPGSSNVVVSLVGVVPSRQPVISGIMTEGNRPVYVVFPESYHPMHAAPMTVLLHGFTGNPTELDAFFGLRPTMLAHGMLYAVASGSRNVNGESFWAATDACCDFYSEGVDDVEYIDNVLATVRARAHVDDSRVSLVGYSNGAFMSFRYACERSSQVASIVTLAGGMFFDASMCTPSTPVSTLHIHGTEDELNLYDGGDILGVRYAGALASASFWAEKNGCSIPSIATNAIDIESTLAGAETNVFAASGCSSNTQSTLWRINGGSHGPAFGPNFPTLVTGFIEAHPRLT